MNSTHLWSNSVTPDPQPKDNQEGNDEEPSSTSVREDADFPNTESKILEKLIEELEGGSKK